ncbi:MAG: T9SS type A sorting domain-containing protein [Bacteroidetes bacterium]|nr:T9SS type A sorting domain-containing protein [Bacteroidota bacterium]
MKKIFTIVLFSAIAYFSNAQTVLVQTNFDIYQVSPNFVVYPNSTYFDGFYISWNDTSSSTKSYYNGVSTSCGLACNAYKFGHDSSTIITPTFHNADSVKFTMKGNGTFKPNKFKIFGSPDSINWTLIHSYDTIPTTKQTVSWWVDPSYTNLKFYYEKDSSGYNVAFDDVIVFQNGPQGIKNISSSPVSVYPNPTKGIVNIDLNGNQFRNTSVVVSDLLGNEIKKTSMKNSDSNFQLSLSEFQDGIYFIKVKTDNNEFMQRVILKK